jgi:hypothetical protein
MSQPCLKLLPPVNVVTRGEYFNNITVVHMFKCELPIVMSIFLGITRESTLQPQVVHWPYSVSLGWE